MSPLTITDKIAQAPSAPGVYLFKNQAGKVIYVGKARNLLDRLRCYVSSPADMRHEILMNEASDVDIITTSSEVDALLLEENLIKLHKPRFNVRLKDDKKFPYIKITIPERYPSIQFTRNLKPDGSVFFGPYTNAKGLRRALKAAQAIFRLRTCRKPLPLRRPERACLNFSMERCCAPCQGLVSEQEYDARVKGVMAILSGRNDELMAEIEQRMQQASEKCDFEQAAIFRDQLFALRNIRQHQQIVAGDHKARDAIGLVLRVATAFAVILKVREGKIIHKESCQLSIRSRTDESEVVEALLRSFYGHTYDLPDEILLPCKLDEPAGFISWFKERRQKEIAIFQPMRGAKRALVRMAQQNAEYEALLSSGSVHVPAANVALGEILGLEKPPRRIEGIDISNLQGQQAVGSIVVFSDQKPLKSEYRRFRIKQTVGPDDYAMIAEVLRRRVKRLIAEQKSFPDLLLVDGGKGQLSVAVQVYHESGRKIPILGFAKQTDMVYYIDGREIQIPASSPALRLLKQIRDEAHRFAITFHRHLRSKQLKESILDRVPGIGVKRKFWLIRHFGSIERLRQATIEELRQVPGIGHRLAEQIHHAAR